jgi:hypothetical protein
MTTEPIVDDLPTAPPALHGFIFSQSSLQDYVDCRRRFLLRCLLRLPWPAVQSEPAVENETYMQKGQLFHHLAQQVLEGVPPARLDGAISEPELQAWWEAFLPVGERLLAARQPADAPSETLAEALLLPEIGLSAPHGAYRLLAKFDLLTGETGRFTIYDWKTSRKRPRRAWLGERLQTRVYPYLLARAGAALNMGQPIPPEAIELVYWFAADPVDPERFPYSAAQFEADRVYLTDLIADVEARAAALPPQALGVAGQPPSLTSDMLDAMDAGFPRTPHEERCAFCVYRSLCDRGEHAGLLADSEGDAEPPDGEVRIDFDQIVEINF